jgi:hypothetical protein
MGYVQSGKTANFTGVVARAADAGYRLIIILAGTWNILRNQTQRRSDKEFLGKKLLTNDEVYSVQPPADWDEFLEHGLQPVELGDYTWQRLTRPDIDFQRLRAAIDNLEFEKLNKAAPLYDPSNLHALPAKLLVVKKHSGILANLVKDLKLIRTRLEDLPTLIIDDESDLAGLNTVDPKRGKERPPTNLSIVKLLGLFNTLATPLPRTRTLWLIQTIRRTSSRGISSCLWIARADTWACRTSSTHSPTTTTSRKTTILSRRSHSSVGSRHRPEKTTKS